MRHFHHRVPGWAAFRGLYAEMVAAAPATGAHFVEVGSWLGKSAVFMAVEIAKSGKEIRFDCVDPWEVPAGSTGKPYSEDGRFYERFLENIAPVAEYINPVRLTSLEAARTYADASLDFVLIDAGHDFASAAADIAAWRPKIMPGGVLAGDDYGFEGVRQAADAAFPAPRQPLGGVDPSSARSLPSGATRPVGAPSPSRGEGNNPRLQLEVRETEFVNSRGPAKYWLVRF